MSSTFSRSHLLPLLLLVAILLAFFASPIFCTSRGSLHNTIKSQNDGFWVTLKHVDSGKNLTKFERIQRGIERGRQRLQKLNEMFSASTSSHADVVTPVVVGNENAEFLMELAIGTPPKKFNAILDTGSDLLWTQCKPCSHCFEQPTPIFDPKKSSSFSKLHCSSKLCKAMLPQSKCNDKRNCQYGYSYVDNSTTKGFLARETFTFGKVSIPRVGFGCADDTKGIGFSGTSGIVGLGRGPLSLVSQLKESKFSYCVTSIDQDDQKGILLMGSLACVNPACNKKALKTTTPLIRNPFFPSFYYASLEGISIGGTRLPLDKSFFALQRNGTGGLIIDSGTPMTRLEERAFNLLKKKLISIVDLPMDNSTGWFDLCFKLPSKGIVKKPKLVLHFEGADLKLPWDNYMMEDSKVACLAMGSSKGRSILGNMQQQNMLVLHDLNKETLSFVPMQCDELRVIN